MKDDSLKKNFISKQDSELLFRPSWVNWHLSIFPYQAFDNRQQRMMNPQVKDTC